jgi:hypothetical protein
VTNPLSGVLAKLNRAEKHLQDIKDAIDQFGDSDFYELSTELDYKRRPVARFRNVQPVDPAIPALDR